MLKRLASWQSPFLYVRLIFWFANIFVSLLPFIGAETKLFNRFDMTPLEFYYNNYQGILAVFIVTISTAMFDVLGIVILLINYNSYIAVPAALILVVLALFLVVFGLALGGAILSTSIGMMHWGFLPLTAAVCLVATGFVAILSSDYRPKDVGEVH